MAPPGASSRGAVEIGAAVAPAGAATVINPAAAAASASDLIIHVSPMFYER